jgi:two-component system, OmpR family, response regulator
MQVLLIEDDERIAADVLVSLGESGFAVEHARGGAEGLERGQAGGFAAIVLDLLLPGIDGLSILKNWRKSGLTTPVLILTARGSWMERVEGLDAGADDYLPKPFRMEELVARLRALTRRGQPTPILKHNGIILDSAQMQLLNDGHAVPLTPQEFKTVAYLLGNAGRVVSAAELVAHVHGERDAVSGNAMEALIGRLRRKVGTDFIETRRGFGYLIP